MHRAATAASIEPVISYLLFPKRWNNFLKHSLRWCKPAFTLRLKQMTPCRWKETWQRPLLLSTSQRQKRPQGTQQNEKLFFSPYHWCLLICPVHREHPLMFCFHVSALLRGYRKEYCKLIFLPCLCWEQTPITLAPLACHLMLTLPVYNQHG